MENTKESLFCLAACYHGAAHSPMHVDTVCLPSPSLWYVGNIALWLVYNSTRCSVPEITAYFKI